MHEDQLSEGRVTGCLARIELLAADLDGSEQSGAALLSVFPDVLRAVQDLNLSELIEVADKLDASLEDQQNPRSAIRMVLLFLVAEQAPLRIVNDPEMMKVKEVRAASLSALARAAPEAAIDWMASADITPAEKHHMESVLVMQLLRNDVAAGLGFMKKAYPKSGKRRSEMAMIPLDAGLIPDLIAAIELPDFEDMRDEIVGMTLSTASGEGGIPAARAVAERLDLSAEELFPFLGNGLIFSAYPAETLDWAVEIQPVDKQLKIIPSALAHWARTDYNTAAEWLGQLPPSEVRDASIEQFSRTVAPVDPQAAMIWADEIQDEETRGDVLGKVADIWEKQEPESFQAWVEKSRGSDGDTSATVDLTD